jgi:hypothetical protein
MKMVMQGRKCGIEEEQLPEVVRFLHNVGAVIHFNDAFGDLSDLVSINPQWLASVISLSSRTTDTTRPANTTRPTTRHTTHDTNADDASAGHENGGVV